MGIKVIGVDRLLKRLNKLDGEVVPHLTAAINKATVMVEGEAKMLCPTNRFTQGGALRASIHPLVERRGDAIVGKVSTIMEYAAFVEFGTGIKGERSNKNKKLALAYRHEPWTYTPDEGKSFYRTIGQVAQPYLYPALNRNKKAIRAMIELAVQKAARD